MRTKEGGMCGAWPKARRLVPPLRLPLMMRLLPWSQEHPSPPFHPPGDHDLNASTNTSSNTITKATRTSTQVPTRARRRPRPKHRRQHHFQCKHNGDQNLDSSTNASTTPAPFPATRSPLHTCHSCSKTQHIQLCFKLFQTRCRT